MRLALEKAGRRRFAWLGGGGGIAAALIAAVLLLACKSPTQVLLDIRTNAKCTDPKVWRGVNVYVGAPGVDVESRAPTLSTLDCGPNGEVGTLVVVPSGAKDEEIGIRVVAGLATNPDECANNRYVGCIVARRSARYQSGETLNVVINLTSECAGVACDSSRTCVNGGCVDARQTSVIRATTDPDAAPTLSGPTVRCGDNGVRCSTTGPDLCCLTVNADQTTTGQCLPATDCPKTNKVLRCDDTSQCEQVDGGEPVVCCIAAERTGGQCIHPHTDAISGAQCIPTSLCGNFAFCEQRGACLATKDPCLPFPEIPGYFGCCNDP